MLDEPGCDEWLDELLRWRQKQLEKSDEQKQLYGMCQQAVLLCPRLLSGLEIIHSNGSYYPIIPYVLVLTALFFCKQLTLIMAKTAIALSSLIERVKLNAATTGIHQR